MSQRILLFGLPGITADTAGMERISFFRAGRIYLTDPVWGITGRQIYFAFAQRHRGGTVISRIKKSRNPQGYWVSGLVHTSARRDSNGNVPKKCRKDAVSEVCPVLVSQ